MGRKEKEAHTLSYDHHLLLGTQRRIGTFILIFSVVFIFWVMLLSSEHHKVSQCQHRASESHYQYVLSPNLTFKEIVTTLNTVFNSVHVTMNFNTYSSNATQQLLVMDTERGLLASNRFYLLKWEDHETFHWNLRTFTEQICDTRETTEGGGRGKPSVSMEVLPNVDYEKAQYRASAVMVPHILNNTHHFMLSSTLNTNDANRICSFVELESVFPGLYALSSADDSIVVKGTYTHHDYGDGDVYYNGQALDITVRIQEWKKGGKDLFWSVLISTISIPAESALVSLHKSLSSSFVANNMFCKSKDCMSPESVFLS